MFKRTMMVIGFFALLAGAAGYFMLGNLDSFVRRAIEKSLGAALGVTVTVNGAHVDREASSVLLSNLAIANPVGYKAPTALTVRSMEIAVDLESFLTGHYVIKSIRLIEPALTVERQGKSSNIKELIEHAQSLGGDSGGEESGKTVEISELNLEQMRLGMILPLMGDKPVELELSPFSMHDIGKNGGSDGDVTVAEALESVFDRLLSESRTLASEKIPEAMGGLKEKADEARGTFGDAGQKLGDTACKGAAGAGNLLKDRLGRLKQDGGE